MIIIYIPADFKNHADDSHISLLVRYNVSSSIIYKWQKELNLLKDRGRPRKQIDLIKLQNFKNKGYTHKRMADILMCSRSTIDRRIKELKEKQK